MKLTLWFARLTLAHEFYEEGYEIKQKPGAANQAQYGNWLPVVSEFPKSPSLPETFGKSYFLENGTYGQHQLK